jgi:betaine-homocysteine S-methyltransferase
MIGETFDYFDEAMIALEVMREAGIPSVVTFAVHQTEQTRDGVSPEDACRRLEEAGADVVGLNCSRGPDTILPILERVRAAVQGNVAALPVPYRTTSEQPTFQSLRDPRRAEMPFPTGLDPFVCTRHEVADFARRAQELGVNYVGLCCGAGPHHVRSLAEALGRRPPASRYSADMSKHAYFGTDSSLKSDNQEYASQL